MHSGSAILSSSAIAKGVQKYVNRNCCLHLERLVPNLFRLIFVLAVLAGLGFAGMVALVKFVHPMPRPMTQSVQASKFAK